MTDLVAALKWVRENIVNFGGDPDRVMIYGQSGGGSKVTTLMGMPAAEGIFHRAAAQSGGGGNIPSRKQQREVARVMMKDLGLARTILPRCKKWSGQNSLPRVMRLLQRSIRPCVDPSDSLPLGRQGLAGRPASMAGTSPAKLLRRRS